MSYPIFPFAAQRGPLGAGLAPMDKFAPSMHSTTISRAQSKPCILGSAAPSAAPAGITATTSVSSSISDGEMKTAEVPGSAWSPFRHTVFTVLWVATVVSNIGSWMQNAAVAVAALFGIFVWLEWITPNWLLTFISLTGIATVLAIPPWQSIVPQ